jgi:hypothetical protein
VIKKTFVKAVDETRGRHFISSVEVYLLPDDSDVLPV